MSSANSWNLSSVPTPAPGSTKVFGRGSSRLARTLDVSLKSVAKTQPCCSPWVP